MSWPKSKHDWLPKQDHQQIARPHKEVLDHQSRQRSRPLSYRLRRRRLHRRRFQTHQLGKLGAHLKGQIILHPSSLRFKAACYRSSHHWILPTTTQNYRMMRKNWRRPEISLLERMEVNLQSEC